MVSAMGGGGARLMSNARQYPCRQIRITAVVIPWAPPIIRATVWVRSALPIRPLGQGADYYHAVGGRHLLQDEEDGDGEAARSAERGYRIATAPFCCTEWPPLWGSRAGNALVRKPNFSLLSRFFVQSNKSAVEIQAEIEQEFVV